MEAKKHLEKEYIFTKLELSNLPGTSLYCFLELLAHPFDDKSDFPVGTITIFTNNLHPPYASIYTADLNSLATFNREIEWNYAYFKKLRLCFTTSARKLKDVKFVFKEEANPNPHPSNGKRQQKRNDDDSSDGDEIEKLIGGGSPKVSKHKIIWGLVPCIFQGTGAGRSCRYVSQVVQEDYGLGCSGGVC
jgi:hypothetical protein